MKITKKQLKALIREQVAAVINETDWRDVFGPDYHKAQGKVGPYADEDEEDEWPEASWEQDQSWRDEKRDIEGRPEEEDSEELRLPNPMRQRDKYGNKLTASQWINRIRDKLREGDSAEEEERTRIISLLQQVLNAREAGSYQFEQAMLNMSSEERQQLIQTLEYLRDTKLQIPSAVRSGLEETLSRIMRITEKKQ